MAALGSSMVEEVGRARPSEGSSSCANLKAAWGSSLISSFVDSIPGASSNHRDHVRVLLHGPCRSGKTSLIMDVAYQAAKSECFCNAGHCACIQVVVFCSRRKQAEFPLMCHKASEKSGKYWDPTVLQRIQIRRVAHLSQILQYLLKYQSEAKPPNLIVLDDMDALVQKSSAEGEASLLLPQIVAILVDTLNSVNKKPNLLVAMESSDFTKPCMPLLSRLVPTGVEILAESSYTGAATSIDTTVTKSFRLQSTGQSGSEEARFSVVDTPKAGLHIRWEISNP